MKRLTPEQIQYVRDCFQTCLSEQLSRMGTHNSDLLGVLSEWTLVKSCEIKIHTILCPGSMDMLKDEIFTNVDIRDFVMSLTDSIFLHMSVFNMEDEQDNPFLNSLAYMVSCHSPRIRDDLEFMEPSPSYPERISESVNPYGFTQTVDVLYRNAWIVTLILIALYGNSTLQGYIQ